MHFPYFGESDRPDLEAFANASLRLMTGDSVDFGIGGVHDLILECYRQLTGIREDVPLDLSIFRIQYDVRAEPLYPSRIVRLWPQKEIAHEQTR